ncbi:glycosyltransferase, group 1 family protein [Trichinella nativa]|uniref:Alpha-1,3/1,6-mannosyltransferase ALG2 n=1 Tax=Trichinella nativa TaxID=6335 RepID=A0A1Y3EG04_9BILA|nr:glycosyltransferase, group 1 family protein [Trichinella nativa]
MRVLVCHPEFWFGGAESVVFDAIQAFNGRNYSVYLVTGHCDSYWLDKLKNSVTESCLTVLRISNRICSVHYPAIPIVTTQCSDAAKLEYCKTLPTNYFLSLNRYWPEKRVDIAIEAFSMLKRKISNDVWKSVNLIIAGSVEERIDASVNCRDELMKLTKLKNIEDKVIFLQNVSSEEKVQLLSRCTGVVYTPPMEHFGITPLEGSYFGKIIIAATGCGTNETVENGKTGILVDFGAENFSDAMAKIPCLDLKQF